MVVNAQIDPAMQLLKGFGQHTGGRHVYRDHNIPFLRFRLGQALMEPLESGGDFLVKKHMGCFSQLPEP